MLTFTASVGVTNEPWSTVAERTPVGVTKSALPTRRGDTWVDRRYTSSYCIRLTHIARQTCAAVEIIDHVALRVSAAW